MSQSAINQDSHTPRHDPAGTACGPDLLFDEREFYWTFVEGIQGGDPNSVAARLTLDEAFERDLPEPIEGLVVRYASLPHAVIGCALPSGRVRAAAESGAIVLRPCSLPSHVREVAGQRWAGVAQDLNFLVDDFEPDAIASLRVARRRLMLSGLAASLAMIAGGLWMRSKALDQRSEEVSRLTRVTLAGSSPDGERVGPDAAKLRLQRERQQLERASGAEAEKARLRDAAEDLAALLVAWPTDLETRANSVQVASTQITLNVEVPDTVAAETLSAALQRVNGWNLQPPRTEITGGQARLTAILRPQPIPSTPAPTRVLGQGPHP